MRANRFEEAVELLMPLLAMYRAQGNYRHAPKIRLNLMCNIACCLMNLDRLEDAVTIEREVFSGMVSEYGDRSVETLSCVYNFSMSLAKTGNVAEAKSLLQKYVPIAQDFLGEEAELPLTLQQGYVTLHGDYYESAEDLDYARRMLEDLCRTFQRVLGANHPRTLELEISRERIAKTEEGFLAENARLAAAAAPQRSWCVVS